MTNNIPEYLRDHSFGDLDTPSIGAQFLIKRVRGVHHFGQKTPLVPKPNDVVTLYAYTSSDQPVESLVVHYSVSDWREYTEAPFVAAGQRWDTLLWGWLNEWRVQLPPQPEGTLLRYHVFARLPEQGAGHESPNLLYADAQSSQADKADQYAIWYGKDQAPEWSKSARIYQIFVDRFNPGQGRDWLQQQDLTRPFGGTLRGVIEKLAYIRDLGFNAIWLTPIFASPSHHGYDTSDYLRIEPRFGSLADFEELVAKAHALGLRVILDFVANHVSDQHPALQEALKSASSPFAAWFKWEKWPEYQSYFNVRSMPELNLAPGSPAKEHLLEAARYWLRLGTDGYRLDYAIGPGMDFWVEFRKTCREMNPEVWTFGEVTRPADQQLSFAGGMDGTLDFLTCQALRESFAFRSKPVSWFAGFLQASQAFFPREFSRPAFLDNHDMNRFRFAAGGSLQRLKLALTWLYLLPGQPLVYFGTENGLSQALSIHDPDAIGFDQSRLPMNWEEIDQYNELAEFVRGLSAFRERFPGLVDAYWQLLALDDESGTALWRVRLAGRSFFAALNRAEEPRTIFIPEDAYGGDQTVVDLLTGEQVPATSGRIRIPAESLLVLANRAGDSQDRQRIPAAVYRCSG
ncbi:MAG: alpha-amylase family glycosyl hydrolase [Anaerolineaceae bacterium]